MLERDIRRVTRYYRARGFYDARVESMQILPDDGEVDIEIRVDEGEPVVVRRLVLTGHEGLPARERRAVISAVKLEKGRRFEEGLYDQSRESIVRELRNRGRARATASGRVEVHTDTRRADVTLTVSAGPVCRFRHIRVHGLRTISATRVIVAMGIDRGDKFSDKVLEDAQSGLFGLGVFERVSVQPVVHPTRPVVDVNVEVMESDFQRLRFGAGFSVDNARSEVHETNSWEHRNLFGGLQLLRITLKPGLAVSPSLFNRERTGFDLATGVDFTWPGFFERETTLIHHGSYKVGNDTLAANICRHDVRTSVGLARPLAPWLRGTVSHEVQFYKPVDRLPPLTCDDPARAASPYGLTVLSYLSETLVVDLRDDPLRTRRGGYFSLTVSESAPGVFSDAGFLSVYQDARAFLQPLRRLGFAGRLGVGRAFPLPADTILPATLRFFSGGASSVRGYPTNTIGAYNCPEDPETECISLGGDVKWEASIEARLGVLSWLRLVAFFDAGDSFLPVIGEKLDLGRHHASAGGGLRFDTPVGPFRIDVAARLRSDRRPEEERAPLSLLGLELPITIHLALGEAY
ncbi:MAG: BamA/TamA family outer membrane protein [Deltaproteobacteria bacterium]|nr:BamA/TamA family outer membrane protein [Deltaproteobacteria bacterium]